MPRPYGDCFASLAMTRVADFAQALKPCYVRIASGAN